MALETVRLLPLGDSSAAPFGIHLVVQGDGFVTLSNADDLATVYLVAIKSDDEAIVELAALKLLPNRLDTLYDAEPRFTNPMLEARFDRERERLKQLRSKAPYFPRLFLPQGTPAEGWLPPLFYSKLDRTFFTPPSPRYPATSLVTCHDDAFLASNGLPLYSSTAHRFLYCQKSSRKSGPPVVFSADKAEELLEALTEAFKSDETRDQMLESFPSKAIREAAKDAPNLSLAEHVTPFTFYDTPFLLTGFSPLNLDELADLISGRPWESVVSDVKHPLASEPLRHAWVGGQISMPRRLLFAHDGAGMDAVEIFSLKLTAFRQVAQALLSFSQVVGQPHLDVHPRHVLFDLSGAGDGLPLFWTFQARLHGLATASESVPDVADQRVVLPPRNPMVPYAAQEVLEFQLAGFRPAELYLNEVLESKKTRRLDGRLSDPYGLYPAPRNRDRVLIQLQPEGPDFGVKTIFIRLNSEDKPTPRELPFVSEPVELSDQGMQKIQKALGIRIPGARYRIFPDFGEPSDLYGLGIVLLRLLLANDAQDAHSLARSVARMLKNVGSDSGGVHLDELRQDPDAAALLSKVNVFYDPADRAKGRPNGIPDALWDRALTLALRLITRIPGYSYAADHADFDEIHRTGKLERVLQEATLLGTEVSSLLFGRQSLNLEIQQVVAEVLAEGMR